MVSALAALCFFHARGAARVRAAPLMVSWRAFAVDQAISMVPTAIFPLRGSFWVSNFTF